VKKGFAGSLTISLSSIFLALVGCNNLTVSLDSGTQASSDAGGGGSGSGSTTLSLTSISPRYGGVGGATTVTLVGTNFTSNTVVQLGTATCINATLQSSTQLTCKSQAHAYGGVDVTVSNGDGTTGKIASGFLYYNPIAITPTNVSLGVGTHQTFSQSGGVGPYVYTLSTNVGSNTITSAGYFTAVGTSATVVVTDTLGNTTSTSVTVKPALAISPTSVTLDVNEQYQFTATGGVSPYTYTAGGGNGSQMDTNTAGLYYTGNTAGGYTVNLQDTQGTSATASVTTGAFATNLDYSSTGNTRATAFLTGPTGAGYLYVGGYGTDGTSHKQWFVRRSSNNGTSWATAQTYQLSAGNDSQVYGMGQDPTGNIYAVGSASDGTNVRWIVQKSTDNGANWSVVHNYLYPSGQASEAHAIASDSSGNLYVAGNATDSTGLKHWIVEYSTNGGTSWATSRDYPNTTYKAMAYGITVDHNNNIYSCGTTYDSSGVQHWLMEMNASAGLSTAWTTSLYWQQDSGQPAQCNSMAVGPNGNVYAVGWASSAGHAATAGGVLLWLTNPGSTSWDEFGWFQDGNNSPTSFNGLGIGSGGGIWVVGSGSTQTTGVILKTNSSLLQYKRWSLTEVFTYSSGKNIEYLGAGVSGLGDPFVVGYGIDSSNLSHGLVRNY
jgi:hypothetical protein